MSAIKKIQENMESLITLGELIDTYQEIAAIRMRKVKKYVLRNREFLSGLGNLYKRIHFSYYEKNKEHKKRLSTYLGKKEGTISVLVTSNTGLYGDIINKTFRTFIENVKDTTTDVAIVGKTGKGLYDSYGLKREYKYFTFSDSGVDTDALKEVLDHILTYSNIVVYHGLFKTVLIQEPKKTFLTGDALAFQQELEDTQDKDERIHVLFEPSMDDIVKFFETQIMGVLFEHIIYESSLSKFASRMVSLERSSGNIEDATVKERFALTKAKHRDSDAKQRDILSSFSLWS